MATPLLPLARAEQRLLQLRTQRDAMLAITDAAQALDVLAQKTALDRAIAEAERELAALRVPPVT